MSDSNKPQNDSLHNFVVWPLTIVVGGILLIGAWFALADLVVFPWSHKLRIPKPPLSAPGFPKTLKPPGGKEVTIPALPVRIVASNCGAADILSGLIDTSRLAAVPDQVENYAADPAFWKGHASIPRFEKFHAERILGYRPDLVISSAFQDGGPAAAIEQQRVPILYLKDFESLDEIRSTIAIIGEAVGAQVEATKMIDDFDERLKKVDARLAGVKPVAVVEYSNFGTGYTVGSGVCQDNILTRAGGVNIAAAQGMKGNVPLTFEQLLRMDPEYIVVTGDTGLESPQAKLILNEPVLKELRAVKNRHIAVVPTRYFDALSQYAVNAVEIIAGQLHPENKP